ncbi:hypothetical protein TRFO_38048 [Tritrichomonas foetus]|uniref:Man1/Src1-like C-terminal domain-containing protein n=1 Tax=Tritrichomonas foetus TaxID=1144522 RepID=A0A1J4J9D2_9EUKA|nr:hypothetical protein TRFO_38048 [Tritrichomonas foetus]|eukprot:OHS95802.1 hypothetical protein TRFO_38048 [Tritrichomonas foetus]
MVVRIHGDRLLSKTWMNRKSPSLQNNTPVTNRLKEAPKKDLFNILLSMRIHFDYNADSETLAKLIENKFDHNSKNSNSKMILKVYTFCHLLFVLSIFGALFLTILMLIIYFIPKKTKFCDSLMPNDRINITDIDLSNKKCIKCPVFGECQNGNVLCDLNYTLIRHHCIFNDVDRIFVSKMLETAYNVLQRRAGDYHCKTSNIDWMSAQELENILFRDSKLANSNFPKIYQKVLEYLTKDKSIIFKDLDDIQVFLSLEIKRDFQCKIRMSIYKRLNYIILISIASVIIMVSLYIIYQKRKNQQIAHRYSSFLIEQMKRSKGSQQTQQQLISKLNMVSSENGKKIWPLVEKKLTKSPFVQSYYNGSESVFKYVF